jgi:hypothetical protein
MPTLINQGKNEMSVQDHVSSSMNDSGTGEKIDTPLTQPGSRDVLDQTRRDLIVMREVHGAESAVGHHLSNIVELIQMSNPPAALLKRQTDGLQRAMRAAQ